MGAAIDARTLHSLVHVVMKFTPFILLTMCSYDSVYDPDEFEMGGLARKASSLSNSIFPLLNTGVFRLSKNHQ